MSQINKEAHDSSSDEDGKVWIINSFIKLFLFINSF